MTLVHVAQVRNIKNAAEKMSNVIFYKKFTKIR